MRYHSRSISLETGRRLEVLDITSDVRRVVRESNIRRGLVNLWIPHTTAAITINEHDPDLWDDILKTILRLVPLEGEYRHNLKYRWLPREQNAHAHILSSLMKPSLTIPLDGGMLQLGSWQAILFIELDGPRSRTVHVTVMGE
ncbi:YjbQ family protein [Candidatus Bathyarchaeota archaeon]|nr:MAG: YjbQ family protein [Candidatus Bathyarchaeota archaeon]